MKSKKDIIKEYYVNAKEIKKLLGISYEKAKIIFDVVDQKENEKIFRAHERKVPLAEALNVADVNYWFLKSQVEGEDERW